MLDLNAMFGSRESIFSQPPRYKEPSVSSVELQMMDMEISADLAKLEADGAKASSTMSQLDQVFNMYNHVKKFGIDRTFLTLFNSNGQLNNMIGVKFPSCESVDSEGYPGSNMSKAFLAAMEDNKEGIFAKIIKGVKWIWEKIKHFCSVVWNKLKSWFGASDKKVNGLLNKIKSAKDTGQTFVFKAVTNKKVLIGSVILATAVAAWMNRSWFGKLKQSLTGATAGGTFESVKSFDGFSKLKESIGNVFEKVKGSFSFFKKEAEFIGDFNKKVKACQDEIDKSVKNGEATAHTFEHVKMAPDMTETSPGSGEYEKVKQYNKAGEELLEAETQFARKMQIYHKIVNDFCDAAPETIISTARKSGFSKSEAEDIAFRVDMANKKNHPNLQNRDAAIKTLDDDFEESMRDKYNLNS